MTLREALLLLSEHQGEDVDLSVQVQAGEWPMSVVHATGQLRALRSAEGKTPPTPAAPDDEPSGLLGVGAASFHLDERGLGEITASFGASPGIRVSLANDVALEITWDPARSAAAKKGADPQGRRQLWEQSGG